MTIQKLIAHNSNYTVGRTQNIKYLVIHYTANNGDTGKGNCNYFKSANRNASAHYFVDENEIWQSVEDKDTAWHCGTKGTYYHKECRNNNAIGIELCSRKDSKGNYYFKNEVVNNAVELTKMLMDKYNIPIKNVIRHYDVTHKVCPAPMVNNVKLWSNFKEMLMEDNQMEILKRTYEYENNKKELEVVNVDGNNFVKVRDLADLLGKKVSYNNNTKVTVLK